jgi:predicted anti-sigma-YlaC factor YlaD
MPEERAGNFMEHRKIKELISSYYDKELDEEQKKLVEKHLERCPECSQEFKEMGKFEEVMSKMELKNHRRMYGGSSGLQSIIG